MDLTEREEELRAWVEQFLCVMRPDMGLRVLTVFDKLSDARIEAKRLISDRGNKQSTLDALVKAVETATAAEIVRLKGMLFGDLSEHDKLISQINKQGGK